VPTLVEMLRDIESPYEVCVPRPSLLVVVVVVVVVVAVVVVVVLLVHY